MKNNLVSFREHYPELAYHIDNHFDDWEEKFNDFPLLDIATSKADAAARKAHYQEQGYRLVDEDYIGLGVNKIAIIQCYLNDLDEPQPEYKCIKVVRILLRKRKDDKIRLAVCLNEDNLWELPSYYVTKGMHVPTNNIYQTEDHDDEYIYFQKENNNIHSKSTYLWRTIESLVECSTMTDEQLHTLIRVFGAVLDWIQFDPEMSRVDYYYNFYKQLHHELAKRNYIKEIDYYLSGQEPIVLDGIYHPAKPELLRKERQTLAHFHPVEQLPLTDLSSYSCHCSLNIEKFGGKFEPICVQHVVDKSRFPLNH